MIKIYNGAVLLCTCMFMATIVAAAVVNIAANTAIKYSNEIKCECERKINRDFNAYTQYAYSFWILGHFDGFHK